MTSPSTGPLRVTPARLRELAAMHSEAANRISQATPLADGTADSVHDSHGAICVSAAQAAARAAEARRRACAALESTSRAYEANLNAAASRYATADSDSSDAIEGEIQQRRR
ncbi:type VII secretion target [Mycobacterium sp. LTG2003]